MNRTAIEWVKNPDGTQGYTWNPITGCLNHTPEGLCLGGMFPCYAFRLANGRLRRRYLWNTNLAKGAKGGFSKLTIGNQVAVEREGDYADPFYPRFWEHRLSEPIEHPRHYDLLKPKGIFVCDMSDLFGIGIPEEWTEQVMFRIKLCPYHRFYLLTKQPQNLIKFSPFPDNCFVGVTVTSNGVMSLAMTHLANIKATVKYISFEPLLGYIGMKDHMNMKGIVDWVVLGSQTKPYRPPQISWVEEIVRAADKAGILVFLKDNLKPLILQHAKDKDAQWADILLDTGGKLRQEMPHSG